MMMKFTNHFLKVSREILEHSCEIPLSLCGRYLFHCISKAHYSVQLCICIIYSVVKKSQRIICH